MAEHNSIKYAGLTDVGSRRSNNQDAFAMLPASDEEQYRQRGHVFLVADGMGAHAVGELASKMAADSIPHIYSKHVHEGPISALRRAFLETNTTIHTRGQQNREFQGMGTTSSALLLRPEGAWISHVGDSRIYRVRDGKMQQLSFDHSLVWEIARRQKCDPDDLAGIPNNVIVRSLGPEPLVQVDIEGPHEVKPGDVYVLCSDGLSGPVSDAEIGAVAGTLPPEDACRLLIDLANINGGPDNITAVVINILGDSESSAAADSTTVKGFHRRRAWHERLPWPFLSLLLGIALAVAAIFLTVNQMDGFMIAFFLAAIALIIGLGGLYLQYRRDETPSFKVPKSSPPQVYRQTPCRLGAEIFEKLAVRNTELEKEIHDNDWPVDWEAYEKHRKKAEAFRSEKDFTHVFRESCLALRVLADAALKHRRK